MTAPTLAPGTCYLFACANDKKAAVANNETNNCRPSATLVAGSSGIRRLLCLGNGLMARITNCFRFVKHRKCESVKSVQSVLARVAPVAAQPA